MREEVSLDQSTAFLNAAYAAYYDHATDEELREASEWAYFGAPALAEVLWNVRLHRS